MLDQGPGPTRPEDSVSGQGRTEWTRQARQIYLFALSVWTRS